MSANPPAVEATGLTRTYTVAGRPFRALDQASLTVAPGEVVAVMGPSGSGKSTLLYLLAGLDLPDEGTVRVAGVDWQTLRGSARALFLRRTCGFIVQGLPLLPQATATENVEASLLLDGGDAKARRQKVDDALERVGLAAEGAKLTDQLSGGQQQRVSIARALIQRPAVVLADEPTASLDSATAQEVASLLVTTAVDQGAAVVLVTHDPAIARHAHRVVRLQSGSLRPDDRFGTRSGGS